jgi:hypothetical protein
MANTSPVANHLALTNPTASIPKKPGTNLNPRVLTSPSPRHRESPRSMTPTEWERSAELRHILFMYHAIQLNLPRPNYHA